VSDEIGNILDISFATYKLLTLFKETTPYLCIWFLFLKVFIVCTWYQGCGVGVLIF